MLTKEEYEAKRQSRYERLLKAAERAEQESTAALETAHKMHEHIPFGQPILVGHHSEKRDRNYRDRIHNKHRRGFELAKKAEEYRSRAASIEANTAIYSDDPEATEKLTDKVSELEAEQREMKRINAALRKGADFETLEMSEKHRKELLDVDKYQNYYQPRTKGFPPYMLTSINSKIKAAKKRAEVIEKKQATPDKDEEYNGIRVEWRASENRIRVFYPGRVDAETFKMLRRHGFRVLRSEGEGAFSAYYNSNAAYFVKIYVRNTPPPTEPGKQFTQSFPNTEEGEKAANQYMESNKSMGVIEVTNEEIRLEDVKNA